MCHEELRGARGPSVRPCTSRALDPVEWRESENNRRARCYSLTRAGREALERETAQWDRR
jgi:hypothetical protein